MSSLRHVLSMSLIAAAFIFAARPAQAHFILVTPDSWMSQNGFGLPEKLGPCGDEGGGTATGLVTPYHPGDTVTVTINEVIPHPGHYRVALSTNDRSELPGEPQVTPSGGDPCASAVIQDPPVFPILADNLLPHSQAFSSPQTFTVTLPTNITCTHCTLQVLEFMSSHGAPCFYHHCADISIQGEPVATPTITPTAAPTATAPPAADCGAVTAPKLSIGKLNTPPGDETLHVQGALNLPFPFNPPLDPLTNGVRLLVDDAAGSVLDVTIPGGPGWTLKHSGTRWAYRSKSATPPGGISMIVIRDRSNTTPGMVTFAVRGKAASAAVAASDLPATARLILTPPPGQQCGQAMFATCGFNAAGSRLMCK